MTENKLNANTGGTCDDQKALPKILQTLNNNDPPVSAVVFVSKRQNGFDVKHYAKTVQYEMAGFCAKSKDQLDSFVAETLRKNGDLVQVRFVFLGRILQRALSQCVFFVLLWPAM